MVQLSKQYTLEHIAEAAQPLERFETAIITIHIQGTTRVSAHVALELVTDALAPFALRVCSECGTATPCECDREQANTFQAALQAGGITLYETEAQEGA